MWVDVDIGSIGFEWVYLRGDCEAGDRDCVFESGGRKLNFFRRAGLLFEKVMG